jgi:hypothetical protein
MEAHAKKRKNGRACLQACRKKPGRRPYRSAEGWSEAEGEATESIAFAVALVFLSSFSAQKSHVKPPKPINPLPHNNIRVAF